MTIVQLTTKDGRQVFFVPSNIATWAQPADRSDGSMIFTRLVPEKDET